MGRTNKGMDWIERKPGSMMEWREILPELRPYAHNMSYPMWQSGLYEIVLVTWSMHFIANVDPPNNTGARIHVGKYNTLESAQAACETHYVATITNRLLGK